MAKRNFIPLVPSGTINADASVAQLEQDVLAMDSKVGELAEDIGDTEQEINQLKSQIDDVEENVIMYSEHNESTWLQGYWAIANGGGTVANDWIRTRDFIPQNVHRIYNNADLLMYLQAYQKADGTYVGTWNGEEFSKTYVANTGVKDIDFFKAQADNPTYKFMISIKAESGKYISPAVDGVLVFFVYSTVKKLEIESANGKIEDSAKFAATDLYEHGEVSTEQNSYIKYPTGSATNRARAKQSAIQPIPEGAEVVTVNIYPGAFNSGKYKIGWAQYTEDYIQIQSTVLGWFTTTTWFTQAINENAKYFMFYYAPVGNTDIDISELTLNDWEVIFGNSSIDYGTQLRNQPLSIVYPKIEDRLSDLELPNNDKIISINHRGYSTVAPENTIPAFILSKKKGFDYVECDVQFTSDDVAVLLHDASINRTARNANGSSISSTVNIADITYEQALTYDFGVWKSTAYAGTKIPTFEEFIVACKKLALHPVIELKDSVGGTYWTDERIADIAATVNKYGMGDYVSFISFSLTALEKISTAFPKAMIALGYEGTYTTETITEYYTAAVGLLSDDHITAATVQYTSMTTDMYEALSDIGFYPIPWTVNTAAAVLSLDDTMIGVLSDSVNAGDVLMSNMFDSIPQS